MISLNDDQEPVVVLGLDDPLDVPSAQTSTTKAAHAGKNWWDDEQVTTLSPRAGRRQGSTALQKAHDVALVASLMRKHHGDASLVQEHCTGVLGWSTEFSYIG